jgi:hypothetical protein
MLEVAVAETLLLFLMAVLAVAVMAQRCIVFLVHQHQFQQPQERLIQAVAEEVGILANLPPLVVLEL